VLFIARGPERRSGQLLLDDAHAGQVVGMAVSEQDGLRLQSALQHRVRQRLRLRRKARINHPAVRLAFRPEQQAVLLEHGVNKGLYIKRAVPSHA
jgi:hypothetical protein